VLGLDELPNKTRSPYLLVSPAPRHHLHNKVQTDDTVQEAGAVVLAKTNLAHTLLAGETVNPLWGRSLNPFNRKLTPGASSGGDAALLAMRGAAIGVGTDSAGSIRVPAK
jgi:Asp-tRNA(Asn)/Glu-tRNA(Gln) amidotransferase A subunit family amidase